MQRERATAAADLPHLPQLATGASEGDRCAMDGCGRPWDDEIHQAPTMTEQAAAEDRLERELGS